MTSVLDLERDGVLELHMSLAMGDVELIEADGTTLSKSSSMWWSFCAC